MLRVVVRPDRFDARVHVQHGIRVDENVATPADLAALMLAFHQGIGLTAGIVYMSGQPYVFVVIGTFLRESRKIRRALEDLARASCEYFSRRATLSE